MGRGELSRVFPPCGDDGRDVVVVLPQPRLVAAVRSHQSRSTRLVPRKAPRTMSAFRAESKPPPPPPPLPPPPLLLSSDGRLVGCGASALGTGLQLLVMVPSRIVVSSAYEFRVIVRVT